MAGRANPLLCELHAHTRWSDGELTLRELVDLYGRRGFDVLCVTDHALPDGAEHVHAGNHAAYLDAIDAEAERARRLYDLLLVPGLELTFPDPDPKLAAHAVAVGLREPPSLAEGLPAALRVAREAGAALVDRFELLNRHALYAWVAERGLPGVASGDFHRLEHLGGWKTLLPCANEEQAVVGYLRSRLPVYLTRLSGVEPRRLAA